MSVDRMTSLGKIKIDALNDPLKPKKEEEFLGFPYESFDPALVDIDEYQIDGYIDSLFDTDMPILLVNEIEKKADENIDTNNLQRTVNIDDEYSDSE